MFVSIHLHDVYSVLALFQYLTLELLKLYADMNGIVEHIYPVFISLETLWSWQEVKVMLCGLSIKGFYNRLSCRHGLR